MNFLIFLRKHMIVNLPAITRASQTHLYKSRYLNGFYHSMHSPEPSLAVESTLGLFEGGILIPRLVDSAMGLVNYVDFVPRARHGTSYRHQIAF